MRILILLCFLSFGHHSMGQFRLASLIKNRVDAVAGGGHLSSEKVRSLCLSPSGHIIFAGCEDGNVKAWEVNNQKFIRDLSYLDHSGPVLSVKMDAQGRFLLSLGADRKILLLKISNGKINKCSEKISKDSITAIAISANGRFVVTGSSVGDLNLYKIDSITGELIDYRLFRNFGGWGAVISAEFDISEENIYSLHPHFLLSWRLSKKAVPVGVEKYRGNLGALAMSGDGRYLAIGNDRKLIIKNLGKRNSEKRFDEVFLHGNTIKTIAFDSASRFLISGSVDRTVRSFSLSDGNSSLLVKEGDVITSSSFSRNGRTAAAVGERGMIRIWRVLPLDHPPSENQPEDYLRHLVTIESTCYCESKVSVDSTAWNGFGFVTGQKGDSLYIATAAHVVTDDVFDARVLLTNDQRKCAKIKPRKVTFFGGFETQIILLYRDSLNDIALLRVQAPPDYEIQNKATYKSVSYSKAYYIGWDGKWELAPEAGEISGVNSDSLYSAGIKNVKPGTSGAPLISGCGITGMIVRSDNDRLRFIPIDRIKNYFLAFQDSMFTLTECN